MPRTRKAIDHQKNFDGIESLKGRGLTPDEIQKLLKDTGITSQNLESGVEAARLAKQRNVNLSGDYFEGTKAQKEHKRRLKILQWLRGEATE
jgi:hypothetical protein